MKDRLNVTWGAVFINCAVFWGRRAQKRIFSVNKNCHRRRVELSPEKVEGRNVIYHPIINSLSESDLWFGLFYFLRKTPCVKGICNILPLIHNSLQRMERGLFADKIRINSPQILRYNRSPDLCQRKKSTRNTQHLSALLPQNGEGRPPPSKTEDIR